MLLLRFRGNSGEENLLWSLSFDHTLAAERLGDLPITADATEVIKELSQRIESMECTPGIYFYIKLTRICIFTHFYRSVTICYHSFFPIMFFAELSRIINMTPTENIIQPYEATVLAAINKNPHIRPSTLPATNHRVILLGMCFTYFSIIV